MEKQLKEKDLVEFSNIWLMESSNEPGFVNKKVYGRVVIATEDNCFIKVDNKEYAIPRQALSKIEENFQLYKNSKEVYFVKYPDLEEKQIAEWEYNELLDMKNRILETKVKEPVIYEEKPAEYKHVGNFKWEDEIIPIKLEISSDPSVKTKFEAGTITGMVYETPSSVVICSVSNRAKGNGQFFNFIAEYRMIARMNDKHFVIDEIYNPRLITFLERNFFATKITNTTCICIATK